MVKASKSDISLRMMHKILVKNGLDMTERAFFQSLHDGGYLETEGRFKNVPTESALKSDILTLSEVIIDGLGSQICFSTKVTTNGQLYFLKLYLGDKDYEL